MYVHSATPPQSVTDEWSAHLVQGLGFRVSVLAFRMSFCAFRVQDFGFRLRDLVFPFSFLSFFVVRISVFGFVSGCFGLRISSSVFRVWGLREERHALEAQLVFSARHTRPACIPFVPHLIEGLRFGIKGLQGYLAHKKHPPRRTLQ